MAVEKNAESRRTKKSERARIRKEAKKARPRAVLRNHAASARKVRLVVDLIRGQDVMTAVRTLAFCQKGAAQPVLKLLRSAIANADDLGFDAESMVVAEAFVNEGRTMRRWRPRARGRATRIRKRSCHTTIILGEPAGVEE